MANHDVLTGLPTLRLPEDRLITALAIAKKHSPKAIAKKHSPKVAVFFIALDRFKTVNDTLGHRADDYVLKETATRLSSSIREVDTAARVGDDEFWILVTDIKDRNSIITVAEKVVKVIATPYEFESKEISISASIGISLYPDHGHDPQKLVEMADLAMYEAKHNGKNRYAFAENRSEEKQSQPKVVDKITHFRSSLD